MTSQRLAIRLATLAIAGFALAACASSAPNTADTWISYHVPARSWEPVDADRQIDISPELIPAAFVALGNADAIQLDPDSFARLAPGRQYPSQTGRVPYLVRGVALDKAGGMQHVMESGDELLVQFQGPMVTGRAICWPVIVLMPAAPAQLYVRISLFNG